MNKEQIFGLIRHLLTVVGGGLVAKGYIDADTVYELSGALVSVVGIVWSYMDKRK